jgi:uncharacterized membrane protein YfcA
MEEFLLNNGKEIIFNIIGMCCLVLGSAFIRDLLRKGFLGYIAYWLIILLGIVFLWTSKHEAVKKAYNKGRLEAFEIMEKLKARSEPIL